MSKQNQEKKKSWEGPSFLSWEQIYPPNSRDQPWALCASCGEAWGKKNLTKLQMWQILLESKHHTDKNIEYFKRKKNISYLKESNLFLFLKTKWGFLTEQLSKLQNIGNFKESGAAVGLLCSVGVRGLLQGTGLSCEKAHQPHQTCFISNSFLISPGFFEATAAEREGCWEVPAPSGLVSLFEQVTDTLTFIVPAETCWPLPVACGTKLLFVSSCALRCALEGPCWGVPHVPGAMQTSNCRCHQFPLQMPGREVEAHRSQYPIPWGFPCDKKSQTCIPGGSCGKGLGELGNAAPGEGEVLGSCLSHWGQR